MKQRADGIPVTTTRHRSRQVVDTAAQHTPHAASSCHHDELTLLLPMSEFFSCFSQRMLARPSLGHHRERDVAIPPVPEAHFILIRPRLPVASSMQPGSATQTLVPS